MDRCEIDLFGQGREGDLAIAFRGQNDLFTPKSRLAGMACRLPWRSFTQLNVEFWAVMIKKMSLD